MDQGNKEVNQSQSQELEDLKSEAPPCSSCSSKNGQISLYATHILMISIQVKDQNQNQIHEKDQKADPSTIKDIHDDDDCIIPTIDG
jgi:hypothetical protein